jgi:putative SOS response-associated peptidase YedK
MSCNRSRHYIQARFDADVPESFRPFYYEGAFGFPAHPVITDEEPGYIKMYNWGLIPGWVKDPAQADTIRRQTINARSDTIFEKPSFRSSIMVRRCLVIADGFFEWQEFGGKKYPYYVHLKNSEAFAIAGIWDGWTSGGEETRTFTLITTEANLLMARIHNTKKRMPALLRRDDEKVWLEKGLSRDEISAMLAPYDESLMEAYTVSKLVTSKQERNVPEVIKPFDYPELRGVKASFF